MLTFFSFLSKNLYLQLQRPILKCKKCHVFVCHIFMYGIFFYFLRIEKTENVNGLSNFYGFFLLFSKCKNKTLLAVLTSTFLLASIQSIRALFMLSSFVCQNENRIRRKPFQGRTKPVNMKLNFSFA